MNRNRDPLARRIAQVAAIVFLLPIIVPIGLLVLVFYWAHRMLLYLLVWCVWLPKGKDALVVYSDSPIWREYMVEEIIPLLQSRAVVLNWSERSGWPKWSFPAHVFRTFGGHREFNPLVVLFRPFTSAVVLRFWSAFKEWKRGDTAAVDSLKRELNLYL